ncbi:MAG: riboflavin biosynthesis protein RibF [Bacteriovoracaceae bacterium]|nr:riboflavin biosynthesis protein RibF [Bacteriovoracaceae bacterium]
MKLLAFPAQILTEFSPALPPLAVAIGNFDGVHRGHQALLQAAAAAGQIVLVITFKPHPVVFAQKQSAYLITPYAQRADYLAHYGADYLCTLDFAAIHQLSPEEFIAKFLAVLPPPVTIVVGENFRFGYQQQGTPQTLQAALPQFKVQVVPLTTMAVPPDHQALPISSGRIRRLLQDGQLTAANTLLGHPYQIQGVVQSGQGLATQLNFPTANLPMAADQLCPPAGVYVATMLYHGQALPAISYLGTRPTIARDLTPLLETHLLQQKINLYEQFVQVQLHLPLRPELKFDSLGTLQDQINTDIHQALAWHQEQQR